MAIGTFKAELMKLPNGLHDAELLALELDLERATLVLRVMACWGGPVSPDPEEVRAVTVRFEGLQHLQLDLGAHLGTNLEPLMIDAGEGPPGSLPPLDHDASTFEFWVFMSDENRFLRGIASACSTSMT